MVKIHEQRAILILMVIVHCMSKLPSTYSRLSHDLIHGFANRKVKASILLNVQQDFVIAWNSDTLMITEGVYHCLLTI